MYPHWRKIDILVGQIADVKQNGGALLPLDDTGFSKPVL